MYRTSFFQYPNHFLNFFRIPELTLLALTFISTTDNKFTLAILHVDHQNRVQLISRDVNVADNDISRAPSMVLLQTAIPKSEITDELEDYPPSLIPLHGSDADTSEAVLLVGGSKLLMYKLSSDKAREKAEGKKRRLERNKESSDPAIVAQAKGKEKEREGRKRKPDATVEWPWGEITS